MKQSCTVYAFVLFDIKNFRLVTYFILFRLNMKPLFGKLTVHQASNLPDKSMESHRSRIV